MSRRPKLSLSPYNNVEKTQAKGFTAPMASSDRAEETAPRATDTYHGDVDAGTRPSGNDTTASQSTTWPDRNRWVKVVLVVVAAALSLYLLKRRLF